MSKIEVNKVGPQCGTTVTIGCGAGQTVVADAATVTLGRCGGTVQLATGATQSGFGRTGTVDWETTPKTATFTAVNGDGFFANTTGSAFNMNLPAGSAGAIVSVADYAGTWQTNALTVVPNGTDKIGGVNANVSLNTEGQSVTFLFVDSTQGWVNIQDSTSNERANNFIVATGGTVTCSGNCRIHTFTGPGTFAVTGTAVCAAHNVVSYVVVGGGGGSGGNRYHIQGGGGGGAGGFREVKSPATPYTASPLDGYPSSPNRITVTATNFPITVGGGGAAGGTGGGSVPEGINATSGANSTFSTITGAGGGFGGQPSLQGPAQQPGQPGGSGGGGGGGSPGRPGGTGNTPPVSPAQGQDGGAGSTANQTLGGSGGGATGAGSTSPGCSPPPSASSGGTGATTSITASPVVYSTGGTYSSYNPSGADPSCAGAANTGDGGDAMNAGPGPNVPTSPTDNYAGKAGGSGIVIIRYKNA